MDVPTAVSWVQAGIWVATGIGRFVKKNEGGMSKPILSSKALTAAIVIGILTSAYSLYLNYRPRAFEYDHRAKFQVISGRFYENEVVDLDGKDYENCTFVNVTLRYDGTTDVRVNHNDFKGTLSFRSDNPAIQGELAVLRGIGLLNVPLVGADGKPIPYIEPPTRHSQ
jgi:hypothetical protein